MSGGLTFGGGGAIIGIYCMMQSRTSFGVALLIAAGLLGLYFMGAV